MKKSVYDLELHEILSVKENIHVLRVPGGWIYMIKEAPGHNVFVPFNNDFMMIESLKKEKGA